MEKKGFYERIFQLIDKLCEQGHTFVWEINFSYFIHIHHQYRNHKPQIYDDGYY